MTLAISDDPAPPRADDTWPLQAQGPDGKPGEQGVAWVFRAPGRREIVNPVILVEGFPGGHPCDYLYELLNASGMVDALHAAGYDVIIVGLDNGLAKIQRNAQVLVQCIREARKRTPQPLVVGGVSMGGLISRYALAWHGEAGRGPRDAHVPEHRRPAPRDVHEPRRAVVRPRARALRPGSAGLLAAAGLGLQRAADDRVAGTRARSARARCATSCWRTSRRWAATRARPRKLAVSCGRGDGVGGSARPARATMTWEQRAVPLDDDQHAARGRRHRRRGVVVHGRPSRWRRCPTRDPRLGDGARQPEHLQPAGRAGGLGLRLRHRPAHGREPADLLHSDRQRARPRPGRPVRPDRPGHGAVRCAHVQPRQPAAPRARARGVAVDRRGARGTAAPRRRRRRAPPHRRTSIRRSSTRCAPAFFQNPYPMYAALREHAPVVPVGPDLWFFLHADCKAILDQTETFLKHPPGPYDLPGIFQSDPPRHTRLRELMGPALCTEFQGAPALIAQRVTGALGAVAPTGHMDAVGDYAGPVAVRCPLRHPRDPRRRSGEGLGVGEGHPARARRHPAAGGQVPGGHRERGAAVLSAGSRPPVPAHRWRQRPARPALPADRARPRGRGRVPVVRGLRRRGPPVQHVADRERHPAAAAEPRPAARAAAGAGEDRPGGHRAAALRAALPAGRPLRGERHAGRRARGRRGAEGGRRRRLGQSRRRGVRRSPEVLDIDRPDNGQQLGFGEGSTTASGPRSRAWWCPPRCWRACSGCPGWRWTAMPQWQDADPYLRALINLPLRFAA